MLLFNGKKIQSNLNLLRKQGYCFNFESGNHFITLCTDSAQNCFLVIHSGDDSYRDNSVGVYLSENVWYNNSINIFHSKRTNRYIRFLIGDPAETFITFAIKHRINVHHFHSEFAKMLYDKKVCTPICKTYQHYGFHSEHTAVLGAGLVTKDSVFPILSNQGLPILIVKPSFNMWSLVIDNSNYYAFPHGWGQEIKNISAIFTYGNNRMHFLLKNGVFINTKIGFKSKLTKEIATVRALKRYMEVVRGCLPLEKAWNNNFYAEIESILFPIASYYSPSSEIIIHNKDYSL